MLSLFAEFIANDRPILVSYKGEMLFPVFVDYPEEKFGGFLAQTDYRDPGDRQGDRRERLDALAADPLLLQHAQPRPAGAGARAADLDADRRAMPPDRRAHRRHAAAATSSGTGSAPTTRAATWWRG